MSGWMGMNVSGCAVAPLEPSPVAVQPVPSTTTANALPLSRVRRLMTRATTSLNGSDRLRLGAGREQADPHFQSQVGFRPDLIEASNGRRLRSIETPGTAVWWCRHDRRLRRVAVRSQ
jgi:hypothetical protein